MKYRIEDNSVCLKITDHRATYTFRTFAKRDLHTVQETNMRMLALMSGRSKLA